MNCSFFDIRYVIPAAAALCLLGALLGFISWQGAYIKSQAAAISEQAKAIGAAEVANAGLAEAIEAMKAAKDRDNSVLEASTRKTDTLAAEARTLERRLKEALRHAKTLDLDAPLPVGAPLALCLRYRAASGFSVENAEGTASGNPDAGKKHPATAFCEPWQRVTLRDALEWLGLLLDHAGAERIDKAALRQWAQ